MRFSLVRRLISGKEDEKAQIFRFCYCACSGYSFHDGEARL